MATGGSPVVSRNLRRNMELAIAGGKTVYRPIDPSAPQFPVRTANLNRTRKSWGRKPKKADKAGHQPSDKQLVAVTFDNENGLSQAV